MADVEQGQTAIFSITITNTGNVYDSYAFSDPTSLEGQQEWLSPIRLAGSIPNASVTRPRAVCDQESRNSVTNAQDPGTFVILSRVGQKANHEVIGEGDLRCS